MLPETILTFHLLCTSALPPAAQHAAPAEIVITGTLIKNPNLTSSRMSASQADTPARKEAPSTGTLIKNPNLTSSAPVDRSDTVAVEIIGGEGHIRMPGRVERGAPAAVGGGWRKLDNIRITDDEIRANVSLDVRNSSNVRIDRRRASISVQGRSGNFTGGCRATDAATTTHRP